MRVTILISACRLVINIASVVFIEYVGDARAGNSWIHCHGGERIPGKRRIIDAAEESYKEWVESRDHPDASPVLLTEGVVCKMSLQRSYLWLFVVCILVGISGSPAPNAWAVANNKLSYDFFFYSCFFSFFSTKSILYFPPENHFFKMDPKVNDYFWIPRSVESDFDFVENYFRQFFFLKAEGGHLQQSD